MTRGSAGDATLHSEFASFARAVLGPAHIEADSVQYVEMRRAFYAGAAATFDITTGLAEEPDEVGVLRLEMLLQELEAFSRDLAAGKA